MIIHNGYENLNFVNPVVTLGIFDGVHRGHRALLDRLKRRAKEVKGESVVITYFPHPRLVISENIAGLTFLTSMEEKKTLLEEVGIDHLIIIPFTYEFSLMKACEFIEEILLRKIGAKHVIMGYNHHFGWHGEGDYETIKRCAGASYFEVERFHALSAAKGTISSSNIRKALQNGLLNDANNLLGYNYFMNGTIVEGRQLGRTIGFPTANIKPDYEHKLIPKDGVYAVEIHVGGARYKGMLSIGLNPTVNEGSEPRTIEVNIFDFDKNIYGSEISIIFRFRLRDEKKFADIKQLAGQLKLDKKNALRLLA
jgi:riboflavin kinase/FMN adenylyltransferase